MVFAFLFATAVSFLMLIVTIGLMEPPELWLVYTVTLLVSAALAGGLGLLYRRGRVKERWSRTASRRSARGLVFGVTLLLGSSALALITVDVARHELRYADAESRQLDCRAMVEVAEELSWREVRLEELRAEYRQTPRPRWQELEIRDAEREIRKTEERLASIQASLANKEAAPLRCGMAVSAAGLFLLFSLVCGGKGLFVGPLVQVANGDS